MLFRYFLFFWSICFLVVGSSSGAITTATPILSGTQAPGTNNGTTFSSFQHVVINDLGNIAFSARLAGTTSLLDEGIWTNVPGSLTLVMREGSPAPGATTSSGTTWTGGKPLSFNDNWSPLTLNDQGQIAFRMGLNGTSSQSGGIWQWDLFANQLVMLNLQTAADTGGTYRLIAGGTSGHPLLNERGEVGFNADTGLNGRSRFGYWIGAPGSIRAIAGPGISLPGVTWPDEIFFLAQPSLNDNGQGAFLCDLRNYTTGDPNTDTGHGHWIGTRGALTLKNITWNDGKNPSDFEIWERAVTNNAGNIATFGVHKTEGEGVYIATTTGTQKIIGAGMPVPGAPSGTTFVHFYKRSIAVNKNAQVVFAASDSANQSGIWIGSSNADLKMIARSGHWAEGMQTGESFGTFTTALNDPQPVIDTSYGAAINEYGVAVFFNKLSPSGDDSLWLYNTYANTLSLVARKGGNVTVGSGDTRTISSIRLVGQNFNLGPGYSAGEDGKPRVINESDQLAYILTFTDGSSGIFVSQLEYAGAVNSTFDANGDGKSDLLWRNNTNGAYHVWTMNGTSSITQSTRLPLASPWSVTARADFNGDGKKDLLWRHADRGDYVFSFMDGTTFLNSSIIYYSGALWQSRKPGRSAFPFGSITNSGKSSQVTQTGDFNGDGKSDLLWRNVDRGDYTIWLMDGFWVSSYSTIYNSGLAWEAVQTGDFNGDGKTDLLWRQNQTGDYAVWLMNGTIVVSSTTIYNSGSAWQVTHVRDFNGDGKTDLLWRNTAQGDYAIWLMNGATVSTFGTIYNGGNTWEVVSADDFNADTKKDLLWRQTQNGDYAIWLMNGLNINSATTIYSSGTDWTVTTTGDFDGNQKVDLVWRNSQNGNQQIWLMNGASVSSSQTLSNN